MKEKVQIHEFDPVIYPRKLWIGVTNDINTAVDGYSDDIADKKIVFEGRDKLFNARTFTCYNEETRDLGIMILFNDEDTMTTKIIAHEATHAARFIWDRIGEEIVAAEADAYLVGWIADCCEKVKLNKE